MVTESAELTCPVEGCTHEPFKTPQARLSHIRTQHPEYLGEEKSESKVPIVEEHFTELLRKFRIKPDVAKNIADNISATGGPMAFEDPEKLLERLALWSKDIPAHMRRNIMDQWFAETGVPISPEIREKAGMTKDEMKKNEETEKDDGDVRYVFDDTTRQIRMAKVGEKGGTLAQAKELKRLAEEEDKEKTPSPFIQDGEGNWTLNPDAKITGIEYLAFQSIKKSQEKGEPADPITAMAEAAKTFSFIRESFGGGGNEPPAWMTDPAAFIDIIKKISGGGEGDSILKGQLATLQQTIETMKEERWQLQFDAQQKQIGDIISTLNKTLESIADIKKGQVGRTEMDIIHEIASEGLGILKIEMPGLRKDVRDAISSGGFPPPKTAEQREERKSQFRVALDADREINELGQRLFLTQG